MEHAIFNGYQVLGDSNFVRFFGVCKNIQPGRNEKCAACIDFCVSGQGIRGLIRLAEKYKAILKNNIIICIGTDNIRKKTQHKTMKALLHQLVKTVGVEKNIIFLTIPPIPLFKNSCYLMNKVAQYNRAIKNLKGCTVLDLHSEFVNRHGDINVDCFEQRYNNKKIDLIHWNKRGIKVVQNFLSNYLPACKC